VAYPVIHQPEIKPRSVRLGGTTTGAETPFVSDLRWNKKLEFNINLEKIAVSVWVRENVRNLADDIRGIIY